MLRTSSNNNIFVLFSALVFKFFWTLLFQQAHITLYDNFTLFICLDFLAYWFTYGRTNTVTCLNFVDLVKLPEIKLLGDQERDEKPALVILDKKAE